MFYDHLTTVNFLRTVVIQHKTIIISIITIQKVLYPRYFESQGLKAFTEIKPVFVYYDKY